MGGLFCNFKLIFVSVFNLYADGKIVGKNTVDCYWITSTQIAVILVALKSFGINAAYNSLGYIYDFS